MPFIDALKTFIRGHWSVDDQGFISRKPFPKHCAKCPKDEEIEKWVDQLLAAVDEYDILVRDPTGIMNQRDGSFTPSDFGVGGTIRVSPNVSGWYDASPSFLKRDYAYFTFGQVLAHELLGRAYAHCAREVGADSQRNELSEKIAKKLDKLAVERANAAFERLGAKPRTSY